MIYFILLTLTYLRFELKSQDGCISLIENVESHIVPLKSKTYTKLCKKGYKVYPRPRDDVYAI